MSSLGGVRGLRGDLMGRRGGGFGKGLRGMDGLEGLFAGGEALRLGGWERRKRLFGGGGGGLEGIWDLKIVSFV